MMTKRRRALMMKTQRKTIGMGRMIKGGKIMMVIMRGRKWRRKEVKGNCEKKDGRGRRPKKKER